MSDWVSVEDDFPATMGSSYNCSLSEKVLVKGSGKAGYPWVAHVHKEKLSKYLTYAKCWSVERDGARWTWLNPYNSMEELQKITHWKELEPPK